MYSLPVKLWEKDELSAIAGGLAHEALGLGLILIWVVRGAVELNQCHLHRLRRFWVRRGCRLTYGR